MRSNLHIVPADSASPPCLQRLERGFLCGEARRIVLGCYHTPTVTVGSLGFGKHTFGKTRSAFEHFANAANFDNVYTDGNNH